MGVAGLFVDAGDYAGEVGATQAFIGAIIVKPGPLPALQTLRNVALFQFASRPSSELDAAR
jgi:hypothetical protein